MLYVVLETNKAMEKNKELESQYTFYVPGDLVTLKHDELNSPIMLVQEKVSKQFKHGDELCNMFIGMKCIWFDKNNVLREGIFSTKDLKYYNK